MAEGVSAEEGSSIKRKAPHAGVYDLALFQNPNYAINLSCAYCGHPPRDCHDLNGEPVCKACSGPLIATGLKVNANPMGNTLIGKAQVACLNDYVNPDADEKKDAAAEAQVPKCEWIGAVNDWKKHDASCTLTKIQCTNKDCKYLASRLLHAAHLGVCGYGAIACPLGCGMQVLRKDSDQHTTKACRLTVMDCTNSTCVEKITREKLQHHATQVCSKRMRSCPYGQYGCPQATVMDEQLQQHLTDCETKHLQYHLNAMYAMVKELQDRIPIKAPPQKAIVEAGMIRMFGGGVKMIPDGWTLCDGKRGAPDLREMFVIAKPVDSMLEAGAPGTKDSATKPGDTLEDEIIQISDMEDEDTSQLQNSNYSMIYIMKC